MSSQDLHQVILRWPHTDANEVIVTGTFDQWGCSLHMTRKPDGFEAPPVFIPWRDKMAYKFIVDGRWMTNDAEPKEIDHGFINNVYTAPPKPVLPEPELQAEPSTAPPSYHSESEVEHEPAEKVAEKPATNGTALHVIRDIPTPTPDAAPEQPRVPDDESSAPAVEAARETVAPAAIEAAQAAVAQVAPAPVEVEKAADEITSESRAPKDTSTPAGPEPVPELAPNAPIGNSKPDGPPENAAPAPTAVVSDDERSTHVPLRFASGTVSPAVVPQVEEPALAPESVPRIEVTAPVPVEQEEPEETFPVLVEEEELEETTPALVEEEPVETPALVEEEEPEETPVLVEEEEPEVTLLSPVAEEKPEPTPVLVEEVESPKEAAPAPAEVQEPEASAAPEPAPAPPTEPEPVVVPAVVEEPVSAPPQEPEEVAAPTSEVPAAVPEPSTEPSPEPEPVPEAKAEVTAVQAPAAEAAVTPAPAAGPTAVVEAAATKAPEPTPQDSPTINGHSKNASTSTAATSLPSTPSRKASHKFSFPGRSKDKSGNSSPTGSARFANQQKRDKRHSLLGKLKEIFSDKGKKEKSDAKA